MSSVAKVRQGIALSLLSILQVPCSIRRLSLSFVGAAILWDAGAAIFWRVGRVFEAHHSNGGPRRLGPPYAVLRPIDLGEIGPCRYSGCSFQLPPGAVRRPRR